MDVIKVSGSSRTSAVAGAIAGVYRENKRAEVQAIGAGAVNQAVKALVLAKGYLAEDGFDIVFTPEFTDVEIDDKVRTAIKMTVLANGDETPEIAPRPTARGDTAKPTQVAAEQPDEAVEEPPPVEIEQHEQPGPAMDPDRTGTPLD